jgi:hypothetical protein
MVPFAGEKRGCASQMGGAGFGRRQRYRLPEADPVDAMLVTIFLHVYFFLGRTPLGTALNANGYPRFPCPWIDPNEPSQTDSDTKIGRPVGGPLHMDQRISRSILSS